MCVKKKESTYLSVFLQTSYFMSLFSGIYHGLHLRHDSTDGLSVRLQYRRQHDGLHQQQPVRIQHFRNTSTQHAGRTRAVVWKHDLYLQVWRKLRFNNASLEDLWISYRSKRQKKQLKHENQHQQIINKWQISKKRDTETQFWLLMHKGGSVKVWGCFCSVEVKCRTTAGPPLISELHFYSVM